MSVPDINPLPIVPNDIDPRFRYGTRAIPENFPQATSRFYLPTQRDSRFWPLTYGEHDNECFDALSTKIVDCDTVDECKSLLEEWCTDGQSRTVQYDCTNGKCVYDFNAF